MTKIAKDIYEMNFLGTTVYFKRVWKKNGYGLRNVLISKKAAMEAKDIEQAKIREKNIDKLLKNWWEFWK